MKVEQGGIAPPLKSPLRFRRFQQVGDQVAQASAFIVRSLLQVLEHYATSGAGRASHVVFAHLIVTPEYVRRVHAAQPDVRIHAIRLDRGSSTDHALASLPGQYPAEESGLDNHQYVLPGAGGLGEVLNNAWV